ncbi:hypothetical protein EDD16DRAFT_1724730 [Pisolithus croceorrhizus]|nr:hypothetical protein EDD16DRAFT_1724730 [Pisolithus croceorrhizus]
MAGRLGGAFDVLLEGFLSVLFLRLWPRCQPTLSDPVRYTREDDIPDTWSRFPPEIRIPKKVATSLKVEGKVWFANERTWIAWLNTAILIGTLALALFNASEEPVGRRFAYVYAAISVGVVIYGFALYQSRISMIRKRDPGHYDAIVGPVVVSVLLFFAVLANFIIPCSGTTPAEGSNTGHVLPVPSYFYCWGVTARGPPPTRAPRLLVEFTESPVVCLARLPAGAISGLPQTSDKSTDSLATSDHD